MRGERFEKVCECCHISKADVLKCVTVITFARLDVLFSVTVAISKRWHVAMRVTVVTFARLDALFSVTIALFCFSVDSVTFCTPPPLCK